MYFVIKSEDDLFKDIERFSELSIAIQQALSSLASLRRAIIGLSESKADGYEHLCREFQGFVATVKGMRDQIGKCDPYHFPALTFLEFSQALHYVLRRVRRILPPMYNEDPIIGISDKLDEIKDWCRPEKRSENITVEEFRKGIETAFEGLINHACRIAVCIRSYAAEIGLGRPPSPTDAALERIETTAEDTNETAHRMDNRDRRHRKEAGKGPQVGLAVQRKVVEKWALCKSNPQWFGDAAKRHRVNKRMAYDYLVRTHQLPTQVDSFGMFFRIIDTARKHKQTVS